MTDGNARPPASLLLARLAGGLACIVCVLWNADLPGWFGLAFLKEQFLATVLGLSLCAAFLTTRWSGAETAKAPWYDVVIATAALAVLGYTAANYQALVEQIGDRPLVLTVIGAFIVVAVLEGLRRLTGWLLFGIICVFVVYALAGHLVPGQLVGRKVEVTHLAQYIGFDPSAVFGTPLGVGAEIVILFVFMGKLLFKAGGGTFFTDLALAATGRMRGGSAKISVIASALFGSISGSAVSNVATTGVITIPLMRRGGYSAVNAGAIEAIASTGGQLMPPIMGAAAFLIAEFLEVPYVEVMLAALIPAALYYVSTLIQVDLIAARDGISVVDEDLPKAADVLKRGWQFSIPLVVLLVSLFWGNAEPERAALYATATIIVLGFLMPYGGERLSPRALADTFWETGLATMELILIVAAAGFVIGILNITGLGFALTLFLVGIAGNSLIVILLVAAGICIVLGMGMPTSGVYVLLAALVGPALIEAGAQPLGAHLFILYFGMMSMITPPIALAAFAAAALTKSGAMETGFAAMRLGWVAYLVPFLFVFSPTLMLTGTPVEIAWDSARALVGIYLVSIAIVGYAFQPLGPAARALFAVAGLATIASLCALPFADYFGPAAVVAGVVAAAAFYFRMREAPPRPLA